MWPSPCSLGSIRLRFTKLLFISRFTKDQAYLHHGTQNSLLCDTGLGHTLHSGVTKSQFSLLKVPSLLHLFLTAGGKGQPFPPVLHLMENLTKCSERKKKKKKEKRHNCFSCSFCLYQESIWCQQRLWMFGCPGAVPSHSEQSSQVFWQTQALGSRAAQKLWLHRLETVEKPLVLPGEPLTPHSNEFETQLNAIIAQDLLFCSCNAQPAQPNPKAGVGLQLKRSYPSALCCVPVLV